RELIAIPGGRAVGFRSRLEAAGSAALSNFRLAITGLLSNGTLAASPVHPVICPVRGVVNTESSFSDPHQNAPEDGEEMTEPSHAVFLSYASEDAEPAERIADALRAAGIEVWFDRNALRGGDEWDRKIRREIKDCALFVPIISAS